MPRLGLGGGIASIARRGVAGGATVPGAPTIGTATAGNAQATVTFTAPGSNGGSPITGYRVTSSPGGITATGAGSPITVTGLTNGTAYTFTVSAQNGVGFSAESAASNSVTPVAATDPNFASVVSLLPLDGSQGSTTFTDIRSKTWTRTSTTVITTAQSQFGGASLDLTTSATDNINTASGLVDFAFPGQFTIECWIRQSSVNAGAIFSGPTTGALAAKVNGTGSITVSSYDVADLVTSSGGELTANTWAHVAITRDASNVIRIFIAGTQRGSVTDATSFAQPTVFVIGSDEASGGINNISAWIDDFRVTKGVARYTSNFTPPTAAHPTS